MSSDHAAIDERVTIRDRSDLQSAAGQFLSGCFSPSFGGFFSSFFGSFSWFLGAACAAGAGFFGASAGAGFSAAGGFAAAAGFGAGGGGLTAAGGFAGAGGLAVSSREFVLSRDGGGVNFFGGCAAPFASFAVSGLALVFAALLFALPAGGFALLGCGCSAPAGFEAL